jgi:hypothetical protein
MGKKNPQKIIFLIVLAILLIAVTYFATSSYLNNLYKKQISGITQQNQDQQAKNINFFKEYSIALNDIASGSSDTDFANVNLDKLNDYASPNGTGYIYELAVPFADLGKDQATKSKDYLVKAKAKLEGIKNNAPNDFFKEDVSNRMEQTDLLIIYANQTYNLLDYEKQELYEINYGSQTKATEYWNKYNALIIEFNSNLKQLSDVQNKIDMKWDQDWYPTFQAPAK